MIRYIVVLLGLLVLTGCATKTSELDRERYMTQYQNESDLCVATSPDYLAYTFCENSATARYFQNVKFPYMGAISEATYYRLQLANRVIAGELTHEQLMYEYMQYQRLVINQAIQKDKERSEDRLNARQARQSFSCFQSGDFIWCN